MPDVANRRDERAVAAGDTEIVWKLVRAAMRRGKTLAGAQREVYGMAEGDLWTWHNNHSRKIHTYRPGSRYYSTCGKHKPSRMTEIRGKIVTVYDIHEGWRTKDEVTCKSCLRTISKLRPEYYQRLQHDKTDGGLGVPAEFAAPS